MSTHGDPTGARHCDLAEREASLTLFSSTFANSIAIAQL
jgi:hypothetical protein